MLGAHGIRNEKRAKVWESNGAHSAAAIYFERMVAQTSLGLPT
jgi:hypothetical protein